MIASLKDDGGRYASTWLICSANVVAIAWPATTKLETSGAGPAVNLLVLPPDTFTSDLPAAVSTAAAAYCRQNLAFFLVEPPSSWTSVASAEPTSLALACDQGEFAAVYFPPARFPGQPSPSASPRA